MAFWLLKTEPSEYSYADLVREKKAVWDGVTNNWALKFIGDIRKDDMALIYHTGKEKCLTGLAKVVSDPYPDPKKKDQKLLVFDLIPVKKLSGNITLKMLKSDSFFAAFLLVKFTRLSVMPVSEDHWEKIFEIEQKV